MIKIYFDSVIYSIQRIGGISIYWSELENYFFKNKNVNIESHTYIKNPNLPNMTSDTKDIMLSFISLKYKQIIYRILSVNDKNLKNKDIFHSSYYRLPTFKFKGKIVTTIHDFTPELYGKNLKNLFIKYLKKKAIKKSDLVICVSDTTKNDLIKLYPFINKEKIEVVYNGVNQQFKYLGIKKDYNELVYIGDRSSKYKNFNLLINSLSKIDNISLTIIGKEFSKKELIELNKLIPNRFNLIKHPSTIDLNFIYNRSFALIYPSSYEGFGIPVLEAMKSGTPSILLKNNVFEELFKNTSVIIEEIDTMNLNFAIEHLKNNYESYVYKGIEYSKHFSWEKCAEETLKLYHKIL